MNYWAIGFLWGSARFSENYLLVQNENRVLLEELKECTSIPNQIYSIQNQNGNITWRLKINKNHEYVNKLIELEYTGRLNNEFRDMPILSQKDEYEFLKGYFSTHFTLDNSNNGIRLRFYAAEKILEKLNQHLHITLGTSVKKISNHSNNYVCKILYYQSKKEVPLIIDYLELK